MSPAAKEKTKITLGLCWLLVAACSWAAPQSGAPRSGTQQAILEPHAGRRLHGRFLHITDVHPDPYYKTYSSTEADAACHRKRGPAGIYGAETSACDSPLSLVDQTFKWIKENLADTIDFVVWTGDSARHDNDEKIPRTEDQVVEQNELLVRKFKEVFGKNNNGDDDDDPDPTNRFKIPIVPTFGNNDILPHNIFTAGPNKWTLKYLDVWRYFIPEAQRHQFQQGGWFYVEVIPSKLAVISLNTIYFFDSNAAVDGCADKREPGYEHMEWLRIQLQLLRERGMKAIIMGHVPPARVDSKESWDETCWQKYTFWLRQYRDVVTGSLFGHMNIDHFMLHDFGDVTKETKSGRMASANIKSAGVDGAIRESLYNEGEITVKSASDYLLDLRSAWAKLPAPPGAKKSKKSAVYDSDSDEEVSIWQWLLPPFSPKKDKDIKKGDKKKYLDEIGGKFAERFSIAHVSPSVVPNYFPTLRVFEYNITGLENLIIPDTFPPSSAPSPASHNDAIREFTMDDEDEMLDAEYAALVASKKKKKKEKDSRKKPKKYKFKIPKGPSRGALPGPAYEVQTFTLLGYTQWYANLTAINNDFVTPSSSLSLSEQEDEGEREGDGAVSPRKDDARALFGLRVSTSGSVEERKWKEGKHGKHQGKRPRPVPHPKQFRFEIEYDTRSEGKGGFGLRDLTVRRVVGLARRVAGGKKGRAKGWEEAVDGYDEYIQDDEEDVDEWDVDEDDRDHELEEMDDDVAEPEDEEYLDDYNQDEDEDEDNSTEMDTQGKKHNNKKKHKKHKKKKNKTWYTFVQRAFVGTMDPRDIEETFMSSSSSLSDEVGTEELGGEEVLEL